MCCKFYIHSSIKFLYNAIYSIQSLHTSFQAFIITACNAQGAMDCNSSMRLEIFRAENSCCSVFCIEMYTITAISGGDN